MRVTPQFSLRSLTLVSVVVGGDVLVAAHPTLESLTLEGYSAGVTLMPLSLPGADGHLLPGLTSLKLRDLKLYDVEELRHTFICQMLHSRPALHVEWDMSNTSNYPWTLDRDLYRLKVQHGHRVFSIRGDCWCTILAERSKDPSIDSTCSSSGRCVMML